MNRYDSRLCRVLMRPSPGEPWRCHWCWCELDKVTATADHLIPRSRGGPDESWNVVCACLPCNSGRKAKLPSEMQLHASKWVRTCAAAMRKEGLAVTAESLVHRLWAHGKPCGVGLVREWLRRRRPGAEPRGYELGAVRRMRLDVTP